MKKTFIIPMAFVAVTSVSTGTGLIANKIITTNDPHTESVMTPRAGVNVTNSKIVIGAVTDATIEVTTTWTDGTTDKVSHIAYEATSTTGVAGTGVQAEPKDGTDTFIFKELTPGASYTITATLSDGTTAFLLGQPAEKTITTSTEKIVSNTSLAITENITGNSIEVTSNWTNGTEQVVDKVAYTATDSTSTDTITTTTAILESTTTDTATITFDPSTQPGPYNIKAEFYVKDGTTPIKTSNIIPSIALATAPEFNDTTTPENSIIITNHSLGRVEIQAKFNDGGAKVGGLSKIEIFEGTATTGTPFDTLPLNEESGYITDSIKPLENGTEYTAKVTLETGFSEGVDNTVTAEKSFKTLESTTTDDVTTSDTHISSLDLTPTGNDFGVGNVEISLDMTIDQEAAGDVTAVDVIVTDATGATSGTTITDILISGTTWEQNIENPKELNITVDKLGMPTSTTGLTSSMDYNVEVKVTSTSLTADTKTMEQNEIITVKPKSTPGITPIEVQSTINADGNTEYAAGDLKLEINPETTMVLDSTDIDVSNASFALSTQTTSRTPNAAKLTPGTDNKITIELNSDLVIPAATVTAGYTIELTGIEFAGETFSHNILTVEEYTGMSDGAIGMIVIGSIAGVALLGGGSFWLYNNQDILKAKSKNKSNDKAKAKAEAK